MAVSLAGPWYPPPQGELSLDKSADTLDPDKHFRNMSMKNDPERLAGDRHRDSPKGTLTGSRA